MILILVTHCDLVLFQLGGSNGEILNSSQKYEQTPSNRGPFSGIRRAFSRLRGRNRDNDFDMSAIIDPEVTVIRDRCDTIISDSTSENQQDGENACTSKCHTGCSIWIDPNGSPAYWWSFIVGCAVLYNYWIIIYRYSFDEINSSTLQKWFIADYTMDLIYLLDILKGFQTAYMDEGVLQMTSFKMRLHYKASMMFYLDMLCLLPLDALYLSIGFNSLLRCSRLVKVYKLLKFLDITERHTNYPNLFRIGLMLHYLLLIFHWNAAIFYLIMKHSSAFSNENFEQGTATGKLFLTPSSIRSKQES